MSYRLDEIDRRIIHAVMDDARNVSAPTIAEKVNVSPGTIRNRISNMEEHEIITGYHASVDFEQADGRLTNLYMCNAPVSEREMIARETRMIAGVINVRELMTGRRNLHVLAVGENTGDLRRIARSLSGLGLEIEDEVLVQNETRQAYAPFGSDEDVHHERVTDFISLSGDAEVAEITVNSEASIAGVALERAVREEILDEDTLVIAIERGDTVLTPHGNTEIRTDDVVTVFSRGGVDESTIEAFHSEDDSAQ